MAVEIAHHRFNLAEYDAMIRHGILTTNDRVQLIAGEIVEMPPIGDPHKGCVTYLDHLFIARLGNLVTTVMCQQPIAIPPDSEPEPDVMLLKPRADFYSRRHVEPEDVLLLIEVSDTTLRLDRLVKVPIYAKAGIAETWIVDLNGGTIETYGEPSRDGYASCRVAKGSDTVAPAAFPDCSLQVAELFKILGTAPG
jgi:Uma2 family endonuclease